MHNIIFAGTPDFSAYHLQALIDKQYKPSLVMTQPDRQSGRGRKPQARPIARASLGARVFVCVCVCVGVGVYV